MAAEDYVIFVVLDEVVVVVIVDVVVVVPVDDRLERAVIIASTFGVTDSLEFDGGPKRNRVERMNHHVGLICCSQVGRVGDGVKRRQNQLLSGTRKI